MSGLKLTRGVKHHCCQSPDPVGVQQWVTTCAPWRRWRQGERRELQDALGLVRQESEAEKYRNENETNKAKIKAKNSLENCCFTVKNTHTEEKFKDKFTRRHGCDGGHQVVVQGRELRRQKTWCETLTVIETMELENMTSQAAQDLEDDEHATNLEKLTLTITSGHANTNSSRNVSRASWTYLTSRGGVLDGSVIHGLPHDYSTTTTMTTYTTQPQKVGALVTHHPG